MAGIHVANITIIRKTNTGRLFFAGKSKGLVDGLPISVSDVSHFSEELRVMQDPNISNSSGYPLISDYLNAEVADGFLFAHMDQTFLITQNP
jgi:hypothetical protein